MATDYDAPRRRDEDEDEALPVTASPKVIAKDSDLEDDTSAMESLELPGAELLDEALEVKVLPKQSDEFTCKGCWMVRHRSQRSSPKSDVCRDCA